MAFLSWRTDYEVGVAQIDTEHRGLFDLINEFHDTHVRGDPAREIAKMLNRLIAYAEEHFRHEEELMSDNGFPGLDKHRELHSELFSTIFAINERLAVDADGASAEILPFIRNWLVEHIVRNDVAMGDFLRRKVHSGAPADDEPAQAGEAAAPTAPKEMEPS